MTNNIMNSAKAFQNAMSQSEFRIKLKDVTFTITNPRKKDVQKWDAWRTRYTVKVSISNEDKTVNGKFSFHFFGSIADYQNNQYRYTPAEWLYCFLIDCRTGLLSVSEIKSEFGYKTILEAANIQRACKASLSKYLAAAHSTPYILQESDIDAELCEFINLLQDNYNV